jgi:hypothetical protein
MITSIYYSSRFKKQLDLLLKADKKGVLAAKQAEAIIDEVRHNGGEIPLTVSLKRTKHGERRAQNCEKYDLGGGYRLITLLDGACLYIAFVGSHDECDLWFKQQRAMDFSKRSAHAEIVSPKERGAENSQEEAPLLKSNSEEDMYESELLNRVDDAILRHVFSGFYQERV